MKPSLKNGGRTKPWSRKNAEIVTFTSAKGAVGGVRHAEAQGQTVVFHEARKRKEGIGKRETFWSGRDLGEFDEKRKGHLNNGAQNER